MSSDSQEVIRLWPEGPPTKIEGVGPEQEFRGLDGVSKGTLMLRNVSDPTLEVFRPRRPNGTGVIVCPGGGWRILAWQHEGLEVARWLAERGYTAFLLKYRVLPTSPDPKAFEAAMAGMTAQLEQPRSGASAPRKLSDVVPAEALRLPRGAAADDGQRAIEIVRARAKEWDIDQAKIGMIGFSAGAFLAADVAMEPKTALAFVAPIYGGETQGHAVPPDAPPLFTVIAQDDRLLFRVVEGLYADWSSADRPAELHIFARGGHGFGMVRQGLPVDRWIDLFGDWLVDRGFA